MEHADTAAHLFATTGALGSALALLARSRRALLGGLALLALAEAGLSLSLSIGGGVDDLLSPSGAALAGVGLAAVVAGGALLVRHPALVPLTVLGAAPFRPPLEYDASSPVRLAVAEGGQLGRLLPLYFVLGASALALAWRTIRGEEPRPLPQIIALPAAAFFAFSLASLLWARDVDAGANLIVFFTLPFAALLAVVGRSPFPGWLPRWLARVAVALAVLFAVVGLFQAATRHLFFFAPNLEVSNANSSYFRVTSLFEDPSLYGRHVVLGIGVVLVLLALQRLDLRVGVALVALLWAGLFFSYSQSSMSALVVVTLAVAVATGDARIRRAVAAALAVAVVGAAGFIAVSAIGEGKSINRITSDRTQRIEDTVRVIAEHPLVGVGAGGQPRASRELAASDRPTPNFVSHTTPLTVAAELGAVGLGLYLWLLAGGARLIDAVRRHDRALGLALGATFLALFVHALFYSGFLEDPVTWVVLAIAAGCLPRERALARDRAPRPPETRPAATAR